MDLQETGYPSEQNENIKGEVMEVATAWAKALELSLTDENRQSLHGANMYNDKKIDRLHPEEDINFWVKYGVRYWQDLKGEVLGKKGSVLVRERINVSTDLAKEAAKKVASGESFSNLTKAEKVSMLTLTRAKLMVAEKQALEVYPGLKSDFDQAKKDVDLQLTDLLVDKTRVRDINGNFNFSRLIPVGKMKVPALITIATLLVEACTAVPAVVPPVVVEPASGPQTSENTGGSSNTTEATDAEKQHIEELLANGGTSVVVETPTSDYVPGEPTKANFTEIIPASEVPIDIFRPISLEELRNYPLKEGEHFFYVSLRKTDSGGTLVDLVNFNTFTNPDVADYEASKEEDLSFYVVSGDEATAVSILIGWCNSKGKFYYTSSTP